MIRATETRTDSSVTVPWPEPLVNAKTAGTNRPTRATTSNAALELATCRLNVCVPWRSPPTSTLAPSTSNRLPMIEPVSDAFTTSMRPACSAKKAMISSAMLPKVALRMPPTCGPVSDPRRSVERPTVQASPRIPMAATTNRAVSPAPTTKSRTIAMKLTTTVPSRKARAGVESGPRMGRPPVRAEAVTGES